MSLSRTLQYAFIAIVTISVGFSLYQWNASRASTAKTAPNNGLVGYWSFNEGTGTLAGDSSVNKNTGTLTNSPTWVSGKLGQAVNFSPANSYMDAGNPAALMPAFPFSVSTWVKDGGIISTGDTANNGEYSGYTIYMYSGGGVVARVGSNAGYCGGTYRNDYSTTATTLTAGQWYHVTVVFTNASSFSIYVNGVSASVSQSGTNGLAIGYAAGARFRIARYFAACGGTTVYSGGNIDETRVYNRALSGTEITNLYNLGAAKLNTTPTANLTSGLVGYWTFDGKDTPWSSSSAGTATDRSGNSNTGTLTNMSQSTSIIPGKVGQALNFDGSNDYVNTGITSNTAFSNATFSVSTWFKTTVATGVIVAKQDSTAGGWAVNFSGSSLSAVHKGTAGGNVLSRTTTATGLNDGNWHHIAFTMTTNTSATTGQNIDIYLDGVLNQGSLTNTAATVTVANAVYIGDRYNTSIPFTGSIDEVRIYNRALSAGEVQSLYDLGASDKVNSSVSQNQGTGRLDSGLAGYWKLDDASGTTATDSSTNGNNGTLTNGPTWGTGQVKGDTVFDGTDDYVNMGSTNINLSATFSISGWIKANSARSQHRIILSKGVKNTGHYEVFIMTGTGELRFYSNDIGDLASGYIIDDNIWHYFSVVYNGTTMNFYVDGVLRASPSASGSIPNETETFYLGRQVDGGGDPMYFNGSIDEVRIYNRALSADEVSQLYRLTAPTGVDTSLKGYWSFNGKDTNWTSTTAGTTTDLSGNGNTGTMTNMSQSTSIIPGKIGQALNFDGADDYIAVANNASLQFSGAVPITLSAWVKPSQVTTFGTFLIKGRDSISNSTNYALRQDSTGKKLEFYFFNTGVANYNIWATSSNVFPTSNIWYHVVVTYTFGTGSSIVAYVNGVSAAGTWIVRSGNETADVDTQRLTIGRWLYTGTQEPFTGQIDEVRIYNRALTAPEVAALYNSGR